MIFKITGWLSAALFVFSVSGISSAAYASCEVGEQIKGTLYVKGNNVNFRVGPSAASSRVINEKATRVLGTVEYRTLSPAIVLSARCETDDWVMADIVEADGRAVSWETGWVHKSFVSSGASADVTAGLIWDIENESAFNATEKEEVRREALRILRTNRDCAKIVDGYRSSSGRGRYYATCTPADGGFSFNVWF